MNLEEIHDLLDRLDDTIRILRADPRDTIEATEAAELCLIVGQVMGWKGSAYYSDVTNILRMNATTLNKFLKLRGVVKVKDSILLADRLRIYLKGLDQLSGVPHDETEDDDVIQIDANISFPGIQWRSIPPTHEVKQKIHKLSEILDDLLFDLKRSNNNPDNAIFTEIDRQQLIAILQTAINILKSPVAEKALLLKARELLQKAAVEAAKKQAQEGVGELAQQGVAWLSDVLRSIFQ